MDGSTNERNLVPAGSDQKRLPHTDVRKRQTQTGMWTIREGGILGFRAAQFVSQDAEAARENVKAATALVGDDPVPVLVDLRESGDVTREARWIYAAEARFASAQALLVDSAFTRVVASLFLRLSRPRQPARMFTSEDEAIAWLRGFLK